MKLLVDPVKIEIIDEDHLTVATVEAVDGIVAKVELKQMLGWHSWMDLSDAVRKAMHMMGMWEEK